MNASRYTNIPLNPTTNTKTAKHLTLFEQTTPDNMRTLNPNRFRSYTKYILTLYDDTNDNDEEHNHQECISCYKQFSSLRKLAAHYRLNNDCEIIYTIDKLSPKLCPNDNCNTWWANEKELQNTSNTIVILLSAKKNTSIPITTTASSIAGTPEKPASLTAHSLLAIKMPNTTQYSNYGGV